jgi:hypothetical protein
VNGIYSWKTQSVIFSHNDPVNYCNSMDVSQKKSGSMKEFVGRKVGDIEVNFHRAAFDLPCPLFQHHFNPQPVRGKISIRKWRCVPASWSRDGVR